MLCLVLDRHLERVAAVCQRRAVDDVGVVEYEVDLTTNAAEVVGRLVAVEEWQIAPHPSGVVEGVVHGVAFNIVRFLPTELAKQPILLKIGNVSHVPHERAHERIELAVEVVVAQCVRH